MTRIADTRDAEPQPEREGVRTLAFVPLHVAAADLGVPQAWLKREADARRISFLTVGRRRVFDVESLKRELTARAEASVRG